jgi:transcriptional regulator with XRE-family HTH domain
VRLPTSPDATDSRADRVEIDLQALDRERHVRGWSREQLARRADLTPNTVYSAYKSGSASLTTFVKMSAALDPGDPEAMRRLLISKPAEAGAA